MRKNKKRKHPLSFFRMMSCVVIAGFFVTVGLASSQENAEPKKKTESIVVPLSDQYQPGDVFMGICLKGTVEMPDLSEDGQEVSGLSGLAWDEDDKLLYAISDRSRLFHIRPRFSGGLLQAVTVEKSFRLRDGKNNPLISPFNDSEGLAIENGANGQPGDAYLIISFEGYPRILRFQSDGSVIEALTLPKILQNRNAYSSKNKSLESVTIHPKLGVLTAPEYPLKGLGMSYNSIFSLDGQSWPYKMHKAENSAVTAMEALPDGSVLVLERAFVSVIHPLIISLRLAVLPSENEAVVPAKIKPVAIFDSSKGWFLDNFEGLAQHQGLRFFMVSDNNENPLQRSLLVYFELVPQGEKKRQCRRQTP